MGIRTLRVQSKTLRDDADWQTICEVELPKDKAIAHVQIPAAARHPMTKVRLYLADATSRWTRLGTRDPDNMPS